MEYEEATRAHVLYSRSRMPLLRRPKDAGLRFKPDDVLWGVARREGYSDTDDPTQHDAVVQHAFEFGTDKRAICGFEPPRRRSRVTATPHPQLAIPGPSNPRCPRCEALLGGTPGPAADVGMAETPGSSGQGPSGQAAEQTLPEGVVADQAVAEDPDPRGSLGD